MLVSTASPGQFPKFGGASLQVLAYLPDSLTH
jgi:hypothetical protein